MIAVISTDVVKKTDYEGRTNSLETPDGIPVAYVNSSGGKISEGILNSMADRWNGKGGEHLTLADYSRAAATTENLQGDSLAEKLSFLAMALCGETGEVAGEVKKVLRSANGSGLLHSEKMKVALELGDALWYVAAIARLLEIPLPAVALSNLIKVSGKAKK